MDFTRKLFGTVSLLTGIFLFVYVLYVNSKLGYTTRTFSPYSLLNSSWDQYKTLFINQDGRVLDHSQGDITTSEGQSYALLRAVWVDDKETFDRVWKWTRENLQKPDHLFGWRWGETGNGRYGFTSGGSNSAADADSDIALALILASRRWKEQTYLDQAVPILSGLWTKETGIAGNERYLIAGNWAKNSESLTVNPSYFSPYAWRIFSTVDRSHNWNTLIDPAYRLLELSGKAPLDTAKAAGLPPDWLSVDTSTGALRTPDETSLKTTFGYDAMRIPWRIALDYQWNKDPRAKTYLAAAFRLLDSVYAENGKIMSVYSHDGKPQTNYESPSLYAASLGYFMIIHPAAAKKLYQDKILRLYSNDKNTFSTDLPYYEQNWLWFGSALYNNALKPFE